MYFFVREQEGTNLMINMIMTFRGPKFELNVFLYLWLASKDVALCVRRKHHEDKKEHKETREKDKMRRLKFILGGWVEWNCDFAKFVDA